MRLWMLAKQADPACLCIRMVRLSPEIRPNTGKEKLTEHFCATEYSKLAHSIGKTP